MKLTVIAAAIAVAVVAAMVMAFVVSSSAAAQGQTVYESARDCVDAYQNEHDRYTECKPGGKYNPYINTDSGDDNSDSGDDDSGNDDDDDQAPLWFFTNFWYFLLNLIP